MMLNLRVALHTLDQNAANGKSYSQSAYLLRVHVGYYYILYVLCGRLKVPRSEVKVVCKKI